MDAVTGSIIVGSLALAGTGATAYITWRIGKYTFQTNRQIADNQEQTKISQAEMLDRQDVTRLIDDLRKEAQAEADTLRKEIQSLVHTCNDQEKKINQSEVDINALRKELEFANKTIGTNRDEIERLTSITKEYEMRFMDYRTEIRNLESENRTLSKGLESINRLYQGLTEEHEILQEEYEKVTGTTVLPISRPSVPHLPLQADKDDPVDTPPQDM